MFIEQSMILVCLATGIGVGLVSSYLGFGGGVLMVPALSLMTKMDPQHILATSLTVVMINALNNTQSFARKNLIPWVTVRQISLVSVVFGFGSAWVAGFVSEIMLRSMTLLIFLLVTLLPFVGINWLPAKLLVKNRQNFIRAGVLAGLAAGFGGLGGATILIPFFILAQWVPNEQVSPTGNAINFFTSAATVMTFIFLGYAPSWPAVFIILLASMITSFFARQGQHQINQKLRHRLVGSFLVLVTLLQAIGLLN